MTEKKKIPQIRFSGFKDDWVTTKLGSITDRVIRKNTNLDSTLPLTISAQYGLVDQRTFFNSQVASQNISNYYLLMNGEFAYNKSTSQDYPVGAVKRLDRYDMGVLSTLYILFKPRTEVSSDYLVSYFDSDCWHREIILRAAEGARNHGLLNISPDDFFDIDVNLPQKLDEQQNIGDFLKQIDLLILHQRRKIDKLKAIKLSMLEEMFPKSSENMPKIRFKKFSGPWKRGVLANYLETSNIRNSQNKFTREDVLSVSGEFGIVNQIKHMGRSYAGVAVDNYGVVYQDDVVYTKSPLREAPFGIIKTNMGDPGIVSALYAVYRPNKNVYSPFVQTYFELNTRLNNYLRPIISKGAKNTINIGDDEALTGEVIFPNYNEQVAICNYFQVLDKSIHLTMHALDKLQSIKKSMLGKMFI